MDQLDTLAPELKAEIAERIAAYPSPREYFVRRVAEGVSMIAAAFGQTPGVTDSSRDCHRSVTNGRDAAAPVRVDLAGGWTDTPPQACESGGAVLNVALELDGRPPVRA